ncbi:MAG: PDZ domain-containing protein, partial [SAR202 cluster bacterium]|nr:PDZ domain-containing protein [SAR202 cluster bacterium]
MSQPKRLKMYLATLVVLLAIAAIACGGDDGDAAESSDTASAPAVAAINPESPVFPEVVQPEKAVERPNPVPENLSIIWEAWTFLQGDYVDASALDPEAFSEEAVRGMLTVLEDRQTAYISPEVVTGSFNDIFRGNFEGIGAHVNMNRAGRLVIVSPIEGGPAEAAGIRPGDIILEVDGEVIEGLSLLGAVARIRGPKGTIVQLLVKHLGALDPVLIPVERNVIPLVSVV